MTEADKPKILLHVNASTYCLPCFEIPDNLLLPEKSWSIQEYESGETILKILHIPNIVNTNFYKFLTTSIIYDFDLDGSIWLEVDMKRINIDNSSLETLRKSLLIAISNIETKYTLNQL